VDKTGGRECDERDFQQRAARGGSGDHDCLQHCGTLARNATPALDIDHHPVRSRTRQTAGRSIPYLDRMHPEIAKLVRREIELAGHADLLPELRRRSFIPRRLEALRTARRARRQERLERVRRTTDRPTR